MGYRCFLYFLQPDDAEESLEEIADAAIAIELGCADVFMNTAIAEAKNPILMASAMRKGIEAGLEAFLAGRMPRKR
jgi:thiazole synthase